MRTSASFGAAYKMLSPFSILAGVGGKMGRGRCWLPGWPSPQSSGTLAAFGLFFYLSACPPGLEKLSGSG